MSVCDISEFAGMDPAVLQAALSASQTALIELRSGAKVAKASYTQGNGARAVEFTQATIADLRLLIKQLQKELGLIDTTRRAIGVQF